MIRKEKKRRKRNEECEIKLKKVEEELNQRRGEGKKEERKTDRK
jgi:hypothetical protein